MFFKHNQSDAILIRDTLRGKQGALTALVDRHMPRVHAVAYAHLGNHPDSEDIVQDTFVSALRNIGELREPGRFGAWITAIARNRARTLIRQRHRETNALNSAAAMDSDVYVHDPATSELHHLLRTRLNELDPLHREILLLHYFAGLSTREIAHTLDVGQEAVKKRLQRARQALGERLSGDLEGALRSAGPKRNQRERLLSILVPVAIPRPFGYTASAGGASAVSAFFSNHAVGLFAGGLLIAVSAYFWYARSAPPADAADLAGSQLSSDVRMDAPVAEVVTPESEVETSPVDANQVETSAISEVASPFYGGPPAAMPRPAPMAGSNAQHTNFFPYAGPLTEPSIGLKFDLGDRSKPGGGLIADAEGNVYFSFGSGSSIPSTLYIARVLADGTLDWTYEPDGSSSHRSSIPIVTPSGDLVMTCLDGTVRSINVSGDFELWSVMLQTSAAGSIASPTIAIDGTVYAAFRQPEGPPIFGGLPDDWYRIQPSDGDATATSSTGAGFARISAQGEIIWQHTAISVTTSPALDHTNETVYFGADLIHSEHTTEVLYAINASNGEVRWGFTPEMGVYPDKDFGWEMASPMVGPDGTIYQQDVYTGVIYALQDQGDRAVVRWAYDTMMPSDAPRTPAMNENHVFFATYTGSAAAIFALGRDGGLNWSHAFPQGTATSSPLATADAVYIAVVGEGAVFAFDADDGQLLWRKPVTTRQGDVVDQMTLTPDGTLYVLIGDDPENPGHGALVGLR